MCKFSLSNLTPDIVFGDTIFMDFRGSPILYNNYAKRSFYI
nr:MAG TPA: hypothetical protein [Caudoviricetes sp.]DAY17675.1 MAG TPA: hypothetical protein [Caudoviricetes sp.]